MAELDFLPIVEGQIITAGDWNALINAIADGSIFTNPTGISSALSTFGNQLAGLENRVAVLEGIAHYIPTREQFVLTANQPSITVTQVPIIDSESANLNGLELAKTGVPLGFVGDYSLVNRTITFAQDITNTIGDGDVLIVKYWYLD